MKRITIVLCLAASGCAHTGEPRIIPRDVAMPVAVSCVPKLPVPPAFADEEAALTSAPNIFEAAKRYRAGLLQHRAYETELLAALKGCAGP